jgi:hypothetical protein
MWHETASLVNIYELHTCVVRSTVVDPSSRLYVSVLCVMFSCVQSVYEVFACSPVLLGTIHFFNRKIKKYKMLDNNRYNYYWETNIFLNLMRKY